MENAARASIFSRDVAGEAPALRRYARSLTRDAAAADDLVQDTLMRAIEGQSSFRSDSRLRPWLLAILHNCFVSDRRRELMRHDVERHAERLGQRSAAAAQESMARLAWLETAVARLPEEQQAVLNLVAVHGFSYADAAMMMAVPIGTVMSRLSRARARLREAEEAG